MKQFFMIVIAWIKAHIWQSVVIGVAAAGVIATSITLPIVLSKEETPQQEPTETNPNSNPDSTPESGPAPEPIKYTVTVINDYTGHGIVELKVAGATVDSGSQILEHTEVTVIWETYNEGFLVSMEKNGVGVQSPTSPYVFTLESDTTFEFVFDGGSPTPPEN